jgi:hypothetical protein
VCRYPPDEERRFLVDEVEKGEAEEGVVGTRAWLGVFVKPALLSGGMA